MIYDIKNKGNVVGFATFIIWSFHPFFILQAGGTPPFLLVGLSLLIASFILLKRTQKSAFTIRNISYSYFGFLGYLVPLVFAYQAISAYEVNVLNYTWPIFLILLLAINTRVWPSLQQVGSLVCGFTGILLAFGWNPLSNPHLGHGHVLTLSAAFIWALYSTMAKKSHINTTEVAYAMLAGAVTCLALHALFENTSMPSAKEWLGVLLFGVSRTSFALWTYALRYGNAYLLANGVNFIPLLSSGILLAFGFQPLLKNFALSSLLIVCANVLAFNREKDRTNLSHADS